MATAALPLDRELIRLRELITLLDPRPHGECRVPGCVHCSPGEHRDPAPLAA